MYVLPQVQADMQVFWTQLKPRLEQTGISGLPDQPEFDDPLASGSVPENLLLLQYCGFPYLQTWRNQLQPLACIAYNAPYCEGKYHRSVVVVHRDNAAQSLEAMRGGRAAINGYDSNTGMNLLRHAVAPLAEDGRFFAQVSETGAHVESLRAVVEKRADIASIDCVTFAFIRDHMPQLTQQVKVLATTATSPALPLFVQPSLPEHLRESIYIAWKNCLTQSDAGTKLRMKTIEPVSDAEIAVIGEYAEQAAKRDYPQLA
jgi:ABC-type phosphate/phosphonate transport system substrate-binding protein